MSGEEPILGSIDFDRLPIEPNAEPEQGPAAVTGQQESDFYKRSGKEWALLENQQNLGLLGKLFGASTSAPTNIAGLVVILMIIALAGTFFMQPTPDVADFRKLAFGTITSALAFIFGAASKK